MPFQEFLPDPRLRPLVRVYWQMEELHHAGQEEHRFLPERSVRLTFLAGSSWRGAVGGGDLEPLPQAALGGLTLQPQRVVSLGLTRVLGAELYPWGARQLLGWHAGAADLDLAEQHGADVRAICALLHLERWEEARQTLEAWLLRLWAERAVETGKGVRAGAQLYTSLGSARIGTLAEELNISLRQLERQFVREVGVNAKTLARLIRFEEVHHRLLLDPSLSLAPLAHDLGFSDQAHLTREFRALSRMTPRTFAQWAEKRWRPVWERELGGAPVGVPGLELMQDRAD